MNLVDEQNRTRILFELLDDLLQTLFEVTAIAGASQKCAHVEREYRRIGKRFRHLSFNDPLGKTFGNRSLADAGITHIKRVVLRTTAEHLNGAADFAVTTDQRIDTPGLGLLIQIDAIGRQGVLLLLGAFFLFCASAFFTCALCAARRASFAVLRALGDAMRNIVHGIITCHLLLLEEIGSMTFPFRKNGNQHVGTGYFLTVRGLYMNDRALNDALESGSWLGIFVITRDEIIKFAINIVGNDTFEMLKVDAAGTHHCARILIVDQGKQKMFERRIFVMPLVCNCEGLMQGPFKAWGERWHMTSLFLHHALQRMLVLAGEIHDLTNFGFGDFVCKYAALADPVIVNMQHDARGIILVLLEKPLQDMNDELHGCVVVIEEQDTIEAGLLGFRLCTRNYNGAVFRTISAVSLALHDYIEMPHETYYPDAHLPDPTCPIM